MGERWLTALLKHRVDEWPCDCGLDAVRAVVADLTETATTVKPAGGAARIVREAEPNRTERAEMDAEEAIKRWGAAKAGVPDEWESITVDFEGWSRFYSEETGSDDGFEVIVRRGRVTLWTMEAKYEMGAVIKEILNFASE